MVWWSNSFVVFLSGGLGRGLPLLLLLTEMRHRAEEDRPFSLLLGRGLLGLGLGRLLLWGWRLGW